ncbi:MAG TPA: DEAD/DEAH box helicase [Candidatus Binatia bacterium]|jgi:ATP-dependent RNA helicase RhlB
MSSAEPATPIAREPLAFADLDLPDSVRRGIEDAGFTFCTPIQAETLPTAITGRDIAGQAQTGTGKTAAFLIAAFTLLLSRPRRHQGKGSCPRVLIIAPTRELAMQIFEEAKLLGKHTGLVLHAVYGGVDYIKQLDRLAEGVDVLIGTPGRLIDYLKQRVFTLKDSEILIVDEADRMFDMGFVDDLRYLVTKMPPATERASFMYSATLSYRVLELAYEYMHDVHRVAIDEEQVTAERVEQLVYHVGVDEKLPVMLNLLLREKPSRALVFVNTRRGVHFVAERLERHGYAVGVLVGDVDQKRRIRTLRDFKEGNISILVATDVASRGLHIEAVSHVFNYDLPQDPEDYVHRIGRTARAGASGIAYSLACEHHVYSLEAIEEFIGMSVPHTFPAAELVRMPRPQPRPARVEPVPVEADRAAEEAPAAGEAGEGDGAPGRRKRRSRSKRKGSIERTDAGAAAPASGAQAESSPPPAQEAADAAGPRRKRRRRRRRRSGDAAAPSGDGNATAGEPG